MHIGIRLLIGIVLVSASGIAAANRSSHAFHGSHGFARIGSPGVFVRPRVFPRVVVRRAFIGVPLFVAPVYAASYYPPPPYYAAPAYVDQGYATPGYGDPAAADIRYYCAEYRDYYPRVASCPSPWLKVMP
jgi:hypothetical protein